MPAQDTSSIKNKIVAIISQKGPLLPVIIAREAGLSTLFASAFLSELLGEKKIGMSNMKIGSSSVYFVPGQEPFLENFSHFLKSKEKDAFSILKSSKILKDSEQEPAIRVALRVIKDFAIPFKSDEEAYWKYFKVSDEEVREIFASRKPVEKRHVPEMRAKEVQTKMDEKTIPRQPQISVKRKKTFAKKAPKDGKFMERIREFLSRSNVEITGIESIGKNEVVLRTKNGSRESLLIAFNKKRITEKEVVKASKKASDLSLRYSVISLGKLPKKTHDLVEALRNIDKIEEIK